MFPEKKQRINQNLPRSSIRVNGREVQMGTTGKNGDWKIFGSSYSSLK